jgi:protein TonB
LFVLAAWLGRARPAGPEAPDDHRWPIVAFEPASGPVPTPVEVRTAGEEDHAAERTSAPTRLPNPDPAAHAARPAGAGPGGPAAVTDRADRFTLKAQPYDDPEAYRLERIRTAADRQSREPERATPDPGNRARLSSALGDGDTRRAARREREAGTVGQRSPAVVAKDDGVRAVAARLPRADGSRISVDGEAPGFQRPAIVRGPAATEVDVPSDQVADRLDAPLRSDALAPARVEFSRPSAKGAGVVGGGERTAHDRLGADPQGRGPAPLPAGSAGAVPGSLELSTRRRAYERYLYDLRQRIDPLWEFPRDLALKLEQGDLTVAFTIRRDGTLREIRVVKGSGFPRFDANVVAAIRHAAPFPPLPPLFGEELRVVTPFSASNPVLR